MCPHLSSGMKSSIVDIEELVNTEDDSVMTEREDWRVAIRRVRGRMQAITAKERTFQNRESSQVTMRFFCDAGIKIDNHKHRVVYNGEVFRIEGIDVEPSFQILELSAWK